MTHKLTQSFVAVLLAISASVAHAETTKSNLPENFTHTSSFSDNGIQFYGSLNIYSGIINHSGQIQGDKGIHADFLILNTNSSNPYIYRDAYFHSAGNSISHSVTTTNDANFTAGNDFVRTSTLITPKGSHTGNIVFNSISETNKTSGIFHEGSVTTENGKTASQTSNTTANGNGSISHSGSFHGSNTQHQGEMNIWINSTTGSISSISHSGSFASKESGISYYGGFSFNELYGGYRSGGIEGEKGGHVGFLTFGNTGTVYSSIYRNAYFYSKDNSVYHEVVSTNTHDSVNNNFSRTVESMNKKDTRTASLAINTNTDGKNSVTHEGSFAATESSVSHEGKMVTDGNGGLMHTTTTTGPAGVTREASTIVTPSTTGGHPTVEHSHSFTPLFSME